MRRTTQGFVDEQVMVTNRRGETVLSLVHVYLAERKRKRKEEPDSARA